MGSVIPATQNLLLAARALGIGGTITTLHRQVEERVHQLFGIPETVQVVYAVPLGYPRGNFGPTTRKDIELVVSEAHVGKNLVLKRGRPRARGRFGRIQKPFSQLTIKVRQVEEQA